MPNVMAAQPNIGGTVCESSVVPFLVPRHKVWLTAAALAVTLAIYENARVWRKVIFAAAKIPLGGKSPQKCIYSVPAQERAKHLAKFCWPPLSDVAAVRKPWRESGWNLLGCPKVANRSQPLVGRRSPCCGDIWRRYCCLTIFRFSIHAVMHSTFALRPHHPICDGRGEARKKEESNHAQDENITSAPATQGGHNNAHCPTSLLSLAVEEYTVLKIDIFCYLLVGEYWQHTRECNVHFAD